MNLSARSVASLVIFEALDALSERIFPPLAGMVTVMSAFWMLDAFFVERHFEGLAAGFGDHQVQHQVVVGLDADESDALAETTTFTARDASMASKSGGRKGFRDDMAAAFDVFA